MDQAQKGAKQASDRTFPRWIGTKIHAVVDALGNPLRFNVTGGEAHDSVQDTRSKKHETDLKASLADQEYDDTNAIRAFLKEQQAIPVIL